MKQLVISEDNISNISEENLKQATDESHIIERSKRRKNRRALETSGSVNILILNIIIGLSAISNNLSRKSCYEERFRVRE